MIRKILLRMKELQVIIQLLVAKCYACFCVKNDIWLLSERGYDARDNAYCFFRYLLNAHPEIDVKYIISKESPDIHKFADVIDRVVYYQSFMHYVSLFMAKYHISSHVMGCTPFRNFFISLDKKVDLFPNAKKIFLQHGIIKDDIPGLYGDNIKLDLFCCGGKDEFEYVRDNYRHPAGVVKYTGLCRYDNLYNIKTKRQILVMPTWRSGIDMDNFEESDYYKIFSSLLTSYKLHKLLESRDYELVFYPHFNIQSKIGSFKKLVLPLNVKIASFEYDVQNLLIESSVLITDWSSVFFDIAYMKKPIIFFLFDEETFFSSHYHRGYFRREFLGDAANSIDEVICSLENILDNGCKMKTHHLEYVTNFFSYNDRNNCLRVYNAILHS